MDSVDLNFEELTNTDHMPPSRMEPEEGGALWVRLTTIDAEANKQPLVGPTKGLAIVVTTEDVVTTLTTGVE